MRFKISILRALSAGFILTSRNGKSRCSATETAVSRFRLTSEIVRFSAILGLSGDIGLGHVVCFITIRQGDRRYMPRKKPEPGGWLARRSRPAYRVVISGGLCPA